MINGQGVCEFAKLRYGLFPVSFNGCEVISVYNALEYLGKPVPLKTVLGYMQKFCVLFGLFGCNVYCIGRALSHFGIRYTRTKSAENAEAFIISSWTGKPFLSSVHTVFCEKKDGKIKVYNRYNKCSHERFYNSPDEIFGNCRVIAVYTIN